MSLRRSFLVVAVVLLSIPVVGCLGRRRGGSGGEPPWGGSDAGVAERSDARTDTPPGPDAGGDVPACEAGLERCGELCVSTLTSTSHCGGCGRGCAADESCEGGACVPGAPACPEPRIDCAGACVDPRSDVANCGGCGVTCAADETCADGACTPRSTCTSPRMVCGGTCTDVTTSVSHCGTCGHACGTGQFCDGGECLCGAGTPCGAGCVDTTTDPSNCGGCGRVCGSGTSCRAGACVAGPTSAGETCAAPVSVPGAGGTTPFTVHDARADVTMSCGAGLPRPDRAFSFRATRSGTATFEAEGVEGTDLVLEVFSGPGCTATASLGCNDDRASGDLRPQLALPVTAGTTYTVVVASYADAPVADSLTLRVVAP